MIKFIIISLLLFSKWFMISADSQEINNSHIGKIIKVCEKEISDSLLYYVVVPTSFKMVTDTIVNPTSLDSINTQEYLIVNLNVNYDDRHCESDSIYQTISVVTLVDTSIITFENLKNGWVKRKMKLVDRNPTLKRINPEDHIESDSHVIKLFGTPYLKNIAIKSFPTTQSSFYLDVKTRLTQLGYEGFTLDNSFSSKDTELIKQISIERGHDSNTLSGEFLDDIEVKYRKEDCLCD